VFKNDVQEVTAEETCRIIYCVLYHCFQNCGPGTRGEPWGITKKGPPK